jgi:hypothetical protein
MTRRNGHIYVKNKTTKTKIQTKIDLQPQTNTPNKSTNQKTDPPTSETYELLLKRKNWDYIKKHNILAFHSALTRVPPGSSKDIVEGCFSLLDGLMTLTETKNTFNTFWKARLFDLSPPSDTQGGLKKILIFQNPPHLLRKIDAALLSRLLAACRETDTPVNPNNIRPLLYNQYNETLLAEIIDNISQEISATGDA